MDNPKLVGSPSTEEGDVRAPSPMEFGSMPLDPVYGWGIVLEPVETLIEETAAYIEQLARETYERGTEFSNEELQERFFAFWDRLVSEGKLQRLPDRPPEFGQAILGPRRWLRAQRIRIRRLVEYWRTVGGPPNNNVPGTSEVPGTPSP